MIANEQRASKVSDEATSTHGMEELVKLTREAKQCLYQCGVVLERISEAALLLPICAAPSKDTMPSENVGRLLSLQEVADRLGVSTVTLLKMRNAGQMPQPIRISERKRMYREADVDEWLKGGGMTLGGAAKRARVR